MWVGPAWTFKPLTLTSANSSMLLEENVPNCFSKEKGLALVVAILHVFLSTSSFFAPLSLWFDLFFFLPALNFSCRFRERIFFKSSQRLSNPPTWTLLILSCLFSDRTQPPINLALFGIHQQIIFWLKTSSASYLQQNLNKSSWAFLLLANI